jgi:hypothetical protein
MGVMVNGESKQWVKDAKLGSNNFIFIEDNLFDGHRTSISGKGSALFVARYNTITNNYLLHAINTLSAQGTADFNKYGSRAVEIYNNTITNTVAKDGVTPVAGLTADKLAETAIMMRGGDALVHDNTIQGFRFAVGASIYPVPTSATYPIMSQPGYLSGLALGPNHTGTDAASADGDLFSYNNNFTPVAGTLTSNVFNNFQTSLYKVDRDYHLVAKPGYTMYTYPHPLQAGLVALKSGNAGVDTDTDTNPVQLPVANTAINQAVQLNLYPNPTNGAFSIQISNAQESQYKIDILDVTGRIIQSQQVSANFDGTTRQLDISDALPGTYFLRVSSENAVVSTKTFQLVK